MTPDTPPDDESPGICIRCFGRAFAKKGTGISNVERGETFYQEYEQTFSNAGFRLTEESDCSICRGVFLRLGDYYDALMDDLSSVEFSTFLVGSSFPPEIMEIEGNLQSILEGDGEAIKKEFNREFGKFIADRTDKRADFNEPDINIVVDLKYDSFNIKLRSLYIRGVYRKLRRDIPQTRWIHKKDIDLSIESIVGDSLNSLTLGKNYFLHGAGREDVDVMMLGNGREFIIESSEPKKRIISLKELEDKVNSSGVGVEITGLRFATKSDVVRLKANTHDKTYRVWVRADLGIDPERIVEATKRLTGKHIYQRTPLRVSTRRSDLVRDRLLHEVSVEDIREGVAVIKICAEAGTYIKELVHGDEGRTNPSLAELYGEKLEVESLDVIWIHRSDE